MFTSRVLLLGLASFVGTLMVTPLVQRVAISSGLTAAPRDDRLHTRPTPYLGGVAILLIACLSTPFVGKWEAEGAVIMAGALVLGLVGLLDDMRNLRPAPRLLAEVGAAGLAAAAGAKVNLFGDPLDFVVTIAWLVVVTNAFNLVDNMDGAATGIATVTATALMIAAGLAGQVLVGGLAAVVAGSCLAFLVFNWHPARIFLGDAGALPVGYLLAVIALKLRFPVPHPASVAAVVLLTAPALFDTALVVISRVQRKVPIYIGGTDHTSHRLLRLGLSTRAVAGSIAIVTALCVSLGLAVGRGVLEPAPVVVPLTVLGIGLLLALLRLPADASTMIEPRDTTAKPH